MLYQILQHLQYALDPITYFLFGPVDPNDGVRTAAELLGLKRLVTALDVTVIMGSALPIGWWGAFHYDTRTITMRENLPDPVFRSVLAHELGHAHYNHSGPAAHDSQRERLADRFAARHLIGPDEFLHACFIHGGPENVEAIAAELGVMPWVVREYLHTRAGTALAGRCLSGISNVIHITDFTGPNPLILGNTVLR